MASMVVRLQLPDGTQTRHSVWKRNVSSGESLLQKMGTGARGQSRAPTSGKTLAPPRVAVHSAPQCTGKSTNRKTATANAVNCLVRAGDTGSLRTSTAPCRSSSTSTRLFQQRFPSRHNLGETCDPTRHEWDELAVLDSLSSVVVAPQPIAAHSDLIPHPAGHSPHMTVCEVPSNCGQSTLNSTSATSPEKGLGS